MRSIRIEAILAAFCVIAGGCTYDFGAFEARDNASSGDGGTSSLDGGVDGRSRDAAGDRAAPQGATYSIGGTVSGLRASRGVTLLDNGGDALVVGANGPFVFSRKLPSGAGYDVTAASPQGETCTVAGGAGTVGVTNVTTVMILCR